MLNVFIGWDSREDIAYQACKQSILKNASIKTKIKAIKQHEVREIGLYYRPHDKLSSTEFSITRFLTPHLSNFKGWSVFCDCDFIWNLDIKQLYDLIDETKAVQVVKHDYSPTEKIKMDNQVQTVYPRKNWSSMILWNCNHPSNKKLTLEKINNEHPSFMHQFKWLDDDEIGELPYKFNFLEGHYDPSSIKDNDVVVHYTRGGPWFDNWKEVDFAYLWEEYKSDYLKEYLL